MQKCQSIVTADNSERRWENNTDRDYAAYLNLKYSFKFNNAELDLKTGEM